MKSRIFQMLHVSIRPGRVLAGCALAALLAGPVRGGTIAHWSFDAADPDGTYHDSVENAHAATPRDPSAVQPYAGGDARFGNAITFAGGANSFLTIPPLTGIQQKSFTVAAWVNFTKNGPNFILADWPSSQQAGFVFGVDFQGGDRSTAQPIADLASNDNAPAPRGRNPGGRPSANQGRLSVVRQAIPNKPVPLNEWHHMAWTWDRENSLLTAYLDGENIGEQKKQTGNGFSRYLDLAANNRTMRIGSREMGNANFSGALDELWIFDQVLTPIQLRNLIKTNDVRGASAASVAGPATTKLPVGTTPPEPSGAAPAESGMAPPPSVASDARPASSVLGARSLSPARLGGIVTCLALIVGISCYLIWAVTERTKLRAAGRM